VDGSWFTGGEETSSFNDFSVEVQRNVGPWLDLSWEMDTQWYGISQNTTKVEVYFDQATSTAELYCWFHITRIPEYLEGEKAMDNWLTGFDLTSVSTGDDVDFGSKLNASLRIFFKDIVKAALTDPSRALFMVKTLRWQQRAATTRSNLEKRGLHTTLAKENGGQLECIRCHSEHNGEKFVPIRWDIDLSEFDHAKPATAWRAATAG
jgi:hypothetical protein